MKHLFSKLTLFLLLGMFASTVFCRADNRELLVQDLGEGHCLIRIHTDKHYLLIPVEDISPDINMKMIVNNQEVHAFDVRLAVNKTSYYVPLDLSKYAGREICLKFKMASADPVRTTLSPSNTAGCRELKLSDSYDTTNREQYRPLYHFTPAYGWMNDPNGMVYKDGEYHLFYQHNPYGSKWGNMNWGHAVSRDLISWEHLPVAIAPDALGTIFSGSAVVDINNTSGFGKGAIVAVYTQNSDRQVQSIAYSTDNGRTFTKYENNPVLVSDVRDFRDPKVFWHEPTGKWVMILAAGQEVRIYSSPNLKEWIYESSFGEGQGAHGNVWECPDLFEIPVEGTDEKKWVMLCSLGDGPFGDSATQYFVGTFDGHRFVNEAPSQTKWMDWGKDHYATVTWSDVPNNRRIALAWMSNWQYCNDVPTMQFRSSNSIPRDLTLFVGSDGQTYLKSAPVPELLTLRQNKTSKKSFRINGKRVIERLLPANQGTYEIEMTIRRKPSGIVGFRLQNSKKEEVDVRFDMNEKRFSIDRTRSGQVSFNENFPILTWVVTEDDDLNLRILVDHASIEAFGNNGRFAMTNLIFPTEPYNRMEFYTEGGSCQISDFVVYNLGTNNK